MTRLVLALSSWSVSVFGWLRDQDLVPKFHMSLTDHRRFFIFIFMPGTHLSWRIIRAALQTLFCRLCVASSPAARRRRIGLSIARPAAGPPGSWIAHWITFHFTPRWCTEPPLPLRCRPSSLLSIHSGDTLFFCFSDLFNLLHHHLLRFFVKPVTPSLLSFTSSSLFTTFIRVGAVDDHEGLILS